LLACSAGTPQLMNLRNNEEGPDEFAVLPTAPLEMPENMASLPEPTPGVRNRVDPDPERDAIAALGGNTARTSRRGLRPGQLCHPLRRQQRHPPSPRGRGRGQFRRRNDGRILERMFGTNVYFRAYRQQALDRYAELERLRRMGVRTPAAPPSAE
jgi:hypothetical protein